MTAAQERKHLKHTEPVADVGWKARVCPVSVGCRGFVSKTAVQLLCSFGMTSADLQRTVKELGEGAEKASFWLWLKDTLHVNSQDVQRLMFFGHYDRGCAHYFNVLFIHNVIL